MLTSGTEVIHVRAGCEWRGIDYFVDSNLILN